MSQSSQSNLVRLTMRARNRRAVKMVGPTERITASEYCSAGVCVGVRKEGIVFFFCFVLCALRKAALWSDMLAMRDQLLPLKLFEGSQRHQRALQYGGIARRLADAHRTPTSLHLGLPPRDWSTLCYQQIGVFPPLSLRLEWIHMEPSFPTMCQPCAIAKV
jgi:hypothetical protein